MNRSAKPIALAFLIASVLALAACGMPWAPTTGPAVPANVYVAGTFTDSGGAPRACYWANSEQTVLDASASIASAIYADGAGSVYVAGAFQVGGLNHACYWRGGTRIDLDAADSSCAVQVEKSGNDVRVLGWVDLGTGSRVLRLWTDDGSSIVAADSPLTETEGGFFMAGPDVYVAGTQIGSGDHAAYYKKNGGAPVVCPGAGPRVAGVWSNGSDVYVYGDIDYDAYCWKNGASIGLTEGSSVSAVATSGSDLFMAGYSIDVTGPRSSVTKAFYWKNKKAWKLPGDDALSKSIQVVGGVDVYNAGWSMYQHTQTACYWMNGTKHDLPGPPGSTVSTASAVIAVPK